MCEPLLVLRQAERSGSPPLAAYREHLAGWTSLPYTGKHAPQGLRRRSLKQ